MGLQIKVPYTLTGPDGTVAVFNDPTSPSYVGELKSIAGLDSPEERESGDVHTERDGGVNDNGYAGRRPIVLEGYIPPSSIANRNQQIERLQRACRARRADAILTWTEMDGIQRRLLLRRQTRPILTGQAVLAFTIGMVSASHLIESTAIASVTTLNPPTNVVATNAGNAPAPPTIKLWGPTLNPVDVYVAGAIAVRLGLQVANGRIVTFDFRRRTVSDDLGTNLYRYVASALSTWHGLPPGASQVGATTGQRLDVDHRHAWE